MNRAVMMALGAGIGAALSAALHNVSWLAVGVGVGVAFSAIQWRGPRA